MAPSFHFHLFLVLETLDVFFFHLSQHEFVYNISMGHFKLFEGIGGIEGYSKSLVFSLVTFVLTDMMIIAITKLIYVLLSLPFITV